MSSQYFQPYRGHIAHVMDNITHVDTSNFALKTNLASLKSEVDKLYIDKLVPVPGDLAKLSNVVKNDIVTKTEYNTLKTKVDGIGTDDYVLKTKYDGEIGHLKLKIPDIRGLVQSSTLNSKLTELENKIPDVKILTSKTEFISVENKLPDVKNLVSKTELTAVENKIRDISNLVTKTDYVAEITKIKNDYVTTVALDARHKGLAQETTFYSEFKKVDDKVGKNSCDILSYESKLKQKEDTLNDLERYASYLRGKNVLVMMVHKIIWYFN